MSQVNQKATLIQRLMRYSVALINAAKSDLNSAYSKDYLTLGLTLAKYYAIYLVGRFVLKTVLGQTRDLLRRRYWRKVAKAKRDHNKALFKKYRQEINALDAENPQKIPIEVSEALPYASISQTHQHLLSRRMTCVQPLNFFFVRAVDLGLDLNLFTEPLYDFALKITEKHDETLSRNLASKKWSNVVDLPHLFGIPLTLKDQFQVEGADTTLGMASRAFKPEKESGLAVRLILEAGGVPFAKTNVLQMILVPECGNFIFGRACNPWNKKRSTGGSSGGDAALSILGATVVGYGTDLAGSCRIPPQFCGIYGIKPTSTRFTYKGTQDPQNNFTAPYLALTAGTMSHSVENLERGLRVLLNPELLNKEDFFVARGRNLEWDSSRVQDVKNKKKLRFGLVTNLEEFQVCKSQERAINEVVTKLKSAGHEIIDFESMKDSFTSLIDIFFHSLGDGEKPLEVNLKGEEVIPEARVANLLAELPFSIKWVLAKLMLLIGEKRYHKILCLMRQGTI